MGISQVERWFCDGTQLVRGNQTRPLTSEITYPLVNAEWADKVPDGFGVGIHIDGLSGGSDVWKREDVYIPWLTDELQVRWIRDRWTTDSTILTDHLWDLHAGGVKAHLTFVVHPQHNTLAIMRSRRDALKAAFGAELANVIGSIGGPNEPNADQDATWDDVLIQMVQDLATVWREDSATSPIPLVSPALKNIVPNLQADYDKLGNLSQYVDIADFHLYPPGKVPSYQIASRRAMAQGVWGANKPRYCTEGGYQDATMLASHNGISQLADSIYTPRHLMEHLHDGQTRFFDFEFLDDPPSSPIDRENHLGMIQTPTLDPASWVKKPAYWSMKRLLSLMSDRGDPYTPAPLSISVTGGGTNFKWRLYGKRNGRYQVALWRDIPVWEIAAPGVTPRGTDLDPGPANAFIALSTARPAKLYDPASGSDAAVRTYTSRTSFTVPVAGRLLILELE